MGRRHLTSWVKMNKLPLALLRRATAAVCVSALWLGGCASTPVVDLAQATRTDWSYGPSVRHLREQREHSMRETWVGRTRADLVAHFGSPVIVAGVPGPRQPPVAMVLYQGLDPRGGCADAFVVRVDAGQEVSDYFCR